jgi:hypothetical protein
MVGSLALLSRRATKMLARSGDDLSLPADPDRDVTSLSGRNDFAVRAILRNYGVDGLALLCAVTLIWFTTKLG